MPSADAAPAADHGLFWLCALCAGVLGVLMATLDDGKQAAGAGSGPTAHLEDAAGHADALFADYLGTGAGLGVLEPLWRLLSPDGGALGVGGVAAAVGAVLSGIAAGVAHLLRSCPRKGGKLEQTASASDAPVRPERIHMSFMVEVHAYWGYLRLFLLGAAREYIIRVWALCGSEMARKHVARDRWNTGWVEFYFQHMYKNIADCFNRPIASAPDACVDVVTRERRGGLWFRVLHDFQCTGATTTCVNLASYNYLGFGGVDEFCTPAARAAALESGFSAGGTRTEGGTLPVHLELEGQIAGFLRKEDAMVLGMGFATNSTILPALFEATAGGAGVLVLSDKLNHRSIVEGVRLSGATVRAFSHNDMADLEAQLKRAVEEGQPGGKPWRKVFVVVEGIYSMEGDFCRLREIVTLKNQYKAYLYLDEAHSIGAVGATGRGVTELLGVPTDEVDVMMGTFTKSFGSAGGYVAASREIIAALRRNAPGSACASAMAPPCAAQALAALRLITGEIGGSVGARKLAQIRDNSNFFRSRLEEEGFKVLGDVDSPIVPVMLHHPHKMARFSRACLERGIAVVIVGYPAVPVLYERVRFCISASHTRQQLAEVVSTVTDLGRSIGVLYEKSMGRAELAARAELDAAYASWLRGAPLQLRADATPAVAAAGWAPEPAAPAAPALEGVPALALEAAVVAEPRGSALDVRLFDPLGWAASQPESARQAIGSALEIYGFGSCGPRGFYGSTMPHIELERALVRFLRTESAISYSAGCATMSSVLPALVQPGDRVVVDSEASLGIRTGLRLCRAEVHWVEHCSLAGIRAALTKPLPPSGKGSEAAAGRPRRTFVVVEALCPRTGRVAPLADLVALKEEHGALLVLDETLSFGTLGAHGRGLCEHASVDVGRVDAIVGSLEHAVAGVGGFCAGRRGLVEHQRLAGAGYCFSAACPPSACLAAAAMMGDLASQDGATHVARLGANAAALHEALRAAAAAGGAAVELTSSPESYVQHLRWAGTPCLGEERLLGLAAACAAAGVRAQVCAPGRVHAEGAFGARVGAPPPAAASLRFCASTRLTSEDIETIGTVVSEALNAQ